MNDFPRPCTPRLRRSHTLRAWPGVLLAAASLPMAGAHASAPDATKADPVEIVMATERGTITLELYPDRAPITVANFLRYVDAGKLDGAAFYRTVRLDNQKPTEVPIQVIQGGVHGGDADPPEGFPPIPHEPTSQTGLRHEAGTVSMARGEPGTATSEFFISLDTMPELDAGGRRNPDGQGFAAFGRVIDGMEVVRSIHSASTATSRNREELGVMQGQLLDAPVRICRVARATAQVAGARAATDACISGTSQPDPSRAGTPAAPAAA